MEGKEIPSSSSLSSQIVPSNSVASPSSNALPDLGPSSGNETADEIGISITLSNSISIKTSNNATESSHIPRPYIPTYLRNTPIDINNRILDKPIILLPSKWNRYDAGADLSVKKNELGVEAVTDIDEAAAIRTDYPIPVMSGIYYFEIDIVFGGRTHIVGVGIGTERYGLTLMPGWDGHSFGYHGDDGRTFYNGHRWETDPYGPLYATGDTIGCCVDFFNKSIFYTKNGVNLGELNIIRESPEFMMHEIYPVIGMKNQPVCVEANFGTRPFKFDIEYYTKKRYKEVGKDQLSYIASGLYPIDDYLSILCEEFRLENLEF